MKKNQRKWLWPASLLVLLAIAALMGSNSYEPETTEANTESSTMAPAEAADEWLEEQSCQLDELPGTPVSQVLADVANYLETEITIKGFTQQYYNGNRLDYLYLHQAVYEDGNIPAEKRIRVRFATEYYAGTGEYIDDAISVTGTLQKSDGQLVMDEATLNS